MAMLCDTTDDEWPDGSPGHGPAPQPLPAPCLCGECGRVAASGNPFTALLVCPGVPRRVHFA